MIVTRESIFEKYDLVDVDESFPLPTIPSEGLILLVGSSGSGKSTILKKQLGHVDTKYATMTPLYKMFSSEHRAEELLIACGLRSVPVWRRCLSTISNGERHRAEMALAIDRGVQTVDEFSSVVDRDTAKSLAWAVKKWFSRSGQKRLVIASCHRDIIDWLLPDFVYDTDVKEWVARGDLPRSRPKIHFDLTPCNGQKVWPIFKKHHYLVSKLNKSCNAWVATLPGGNPVGFCAILAFPNANFRNAWREHRTVILPEFQGLGIGSAISDCIAQMVVESGGRFFSKTSHPAFGNHRENSPLWAPTSKNRSRRLDYQVASVADHKESKHMLAHANRRCWSHEFIGATGQGD